MAARRKEKGKPAPRREKQSPAAAASKGGKGAAPADFFPPGFDTAIELPEVKDTDLVTYFLQADKRGLELYTEHAKRHYQDGFRAVIVGAPTFTFDRPVVQLLGRVRGDHFQRAVEWAKSNPIKELHAKYLLAGGGSQVERQKALDAYSKAKAALVAHDEKRQALLDAIDAASVGLVQRFGKGPLEIEGETHDPSYTREVVYWKKRGGVSVSQGKVQNGAGKHG